MILMVSMLPLKWQELWKAFMTWAQWSTMAATTTSSGVGVGGTQIVTSVASVRTYLSTWFARFHTRTCCDLICFLCYLWLLSITGYETMGVENFHQPVYFSKTIFHIAIIFYLRYSNIVSIIYTYIHNHIYIYNIHIHTHFIVIIHIYIHILSSYIYIEEYI